MTVMVKKMKKMKMMKNDEGNEDEENGENRITVERLVRQVLASRVQLNSFTTTHSLTSSNAKPRFHQPLRFHFSIVLVYPRLRVSSMQSIALLSFLSYSYQLCA